MGDGLERVSADPTTLKRLTELHQTSLPFPVQHRILRVLQQRLERSAFEAIRQRHPQLGQSNGWDCAEKVELHLACRALDRIFRTPSPSGVKTVSKKRIHRLRSDIEGIRHAAVHRQWVDHRRLLEQLRSAREFVTACLGDDHCGREIEQCQGRVDSLFSEWQGRTHRLRRNLAARTGRNPLPEGCHHPQLLREAAGRLAEKINHECMKQVEHILRLSFPSLHMT